MKKDDEELLARLSKEHPEALEADINVSVIDGLIRRLIKAPPAPKRKRKRGRGGITKSQAKRKSC
jgi:hypothetical protein